MKTGSVFLKGCFVVAVFVAATPAWCQDESPFTQVFDTTAGHTLPLADSAIAERKDWTLVPEDTIEHRFSGDAVLLNDRLAVVFRRVITGAEVYAKSAGGWKRRANLYHLATLAAAADEQTAFKLIENTSGAVMLQVEFGGNRPAALRFRLTTGEAILEIRSDDHAGFLAVDSATRYVVVPDYFGDDMVFEADSLARPTEVARASVCLPAENFCLNLLAGGDAMVMSVWQTSGQEVWFSGSTADSPGWMPSNRIRCAAGKSIWLAFLEAPNLWHASTLALQREWKPPFAAKWRGSLISTNWVADSWDVERGPVPAKTTAIPQARLLVYPNDRSLATPLTVTCPTDVMRNTLGVGPCQYILACEGMAGNPTSDSVMDWVEKQFARKKATAMADDINERLELMIRHVADARTRIARYAEFASRVRKILDHHPGADPFTPIVDDLDRFVVAGLASTASPEHARELATAVTALIGQPDALAACQRLGAELRSIGAVQDGALARCRMAVRRLQAQSRTLAAEQPVESELIRNVQGLAEQMLQRK